MLRMSVFLLLSLQPLEVSFTLHITCIIFPQLSVPDSFLVELNPLCNTMTLKETLGSHKDSLCHNHAGEFKCLFCLSFCYEIMRQSLTTMEKGQLVQSKADGAALRRGSGSGNAIISARRDRSLPSHVATNAQDIKINRLSKFDA